VKKSGAKKGSVSIDVIEAPHPVKVSLHSLDAVRREMASVYRLCKSGQMDVTEGSKLSYQLQNIGRMIEASVIEKRLTALENGVAEDQGDVQDVEFEEVTVNA
jgi:hypothetical protein